jgi:diaminopimelate epimerase
VRFHKYQALGNDYLVLEPPPGVILDAPLVRAICDRHFGLGADGVLLGAPAGGGFTLRIFNPDGSEAEKSGNGLRIFARFLWDGGQVGGEPFAVTTRGGPVRCQIREGGRSIFVEMGQATFASERIPVAGPAREVVNEALSLPGESLRFTAVSVGNPHCVIHLDEISAALAHRLGPLIETHQLFPRRTNVQLVKVLSPHRLQIEIWERGAGYTLASGSSSCAAAAASVRLGLCAGDITVVMPGGSLEIGVMDDFTLTMLGPAAKVAEGMLSPELLGEG